jgi:DNA polymerase I-like protein with 3'-5' exonuclease and polymerase domains
VAKYVVLDLETSTKESYGRIANPFDKDNYIVSMGLKYSNGRRIKTHISQENAIPEGDWLKGVGAIVGINLKFDLLYLWRHPVLVNFFKRGGRIYDCQYARYFITAQQEKYASMDSMANIYGLPLKPDKIKEYWKNGIDTIDIPKQELLDYLDHDLDTTEGIFKGVAKEANKLGMTAMIRERMDSLCGNIEMEFNGLKVDLEVAERNESKLRKEIEGLYRELEQYTPQLPEGAEFNWSSGRQLSAFLFGGPIKYKTREPKVDMDGKQEYFKKTVEVPALDPHGNEVRYKTGDKKGQLKTKKVKINDLDRPKYKIAQTEYPLTGLTKPRKEWGLKEPGFYKTGEDVIKELSARGIEVAKILAKLKKKEKDLSAFYSSGMLRYAQDGVIHHTLNNVQTDTGRLSSSKPNAQQIPRGNTSDVREMFVSHFEGGEVAEVDFCVVPGTRILTHNFSHVPIEELEVGQELVAFDEDLKSYGNTQFRKAVVEKKEMIERPCLKITFEDGTNVVCSSEHQWVARKYWGGANKWIKAEDLQENDTLVKVVPVWEDLDQTIEGAWMAGFLDGEGWIGQNGSTVGFGQTEKTYDNAIVGKKAVEIGSKLNDLDISTSYNLNMCTNYNFRGQRPAWQVVGTYKPIRLLHKLQQRYEGTIIRGKRNKPQKIVKIEDVGNKTVIALRTSTRTFIAEGMLSHNCSLEVVIQAWISKDKNMIQNVNDGVDFHSLRLAAKLGEDYDEVVRKAKKEKDPYYDLERTKAKGFSFQRAYGAGAKAIAASTGMSIEEVEAFIEAENRMYPNVEKYNAWVARQVDKNSVETDTCINGVPVKFGWHRATTGTNARYGFTQQEAPDFMKDRGVEVSFSPTQMKNYSIQGEAGGVVASAVGMVWRKFVETDNFNNTALLMNTVHDCIWISLAKGARDSVIPEVEKAMTAIPERYKEVYGVDVPVIFRVESEVGPNMKDLH